MKKPLLIEPQRIYAPILALVFILGVAFRVYALFVVGFDTPFDLGGLFYQMSLEIAYNGFALPDAIPYYYPGGLPFAYPPLAFYIQAALISLFSPRLFITVNLLPALFSVLSLGAFYLLACEVFERRWLRLAALFIFAIIPLAVTEQVQAMGLAEALGTSAIILYTRALLRSVRQAKTARFIVAGLMLALCVVSSPGSLYAAVLISLGFLVYAVVAWTRKRNRRYVIGGIVIAFTGLVASAPYWLTVMINHGVGIFLGAFAGQNSSLLGELKENFLVFRLIWATPLWNGIFLVSLVLVLWRRQYWLVIYTLVLMVILRERWLMSIPVSLVIAGALGILLDLLSRIRWKKMALVKVSVIWILIIVMLFDAGSYLKYIVDDDAYGLPVEMVAELQQINSAQLIPPGQPVVAVGNWGLVEWSPALLEREVINNPYGLEWVPGREMQMDALTRELQKTTDPLSVASVIRQYFPEVRSVYLVMDNTFIDSAQLRRLNSGQFRIIESNDKLTLAMLVW